VRSASSPTDCRSWEQSTDIPSTRPICVVPTTRSVSAPTAPAATLSTAWKSWLPDHRITDRGVQLHPHQHHPLLPTKLPPPLLPSDNCPSTRQNAFLPLPVLPHGQCADLSKASACPV
jgi:hypothetical protein